MFEGRVAGTALGAPLLSAAYPCAARERWAVWVLHCAGKRLGRKGRRERAMVSQAVCCLCVSRSLLSLSSFKISTVYLNIASFLRALLLTDAGYAVRKTEAKRAVEITSCPPSPLQLLFPSAPSVMLKVYSVPLVAFLCCASSLPPEFKRKAKDAPLVAAPFDVRFTVAQLCTSDYTHRRPRPH